MRAISSRRSRDDRSSSGARILSRATTRRRTGSRRSTCATNSLTPLLQVARDRVRRRTRRVRRGDRPRMRDADVGRAGRGPTRVAVTGLDLARSSTIQRVPTRHGVHFPHDSCIRTSSSAAPSCTMQQRSSTTISDAAPKNVPIFAERVVVERPRRSGPASAAGTDEPPGITALSSRPPAMPPAELVDQLAHRRAEHQLVVAGRTTLPETEKIAVPGAPSARRSSRTPPAPMLRMSGTVAIVQDVVDLRRRHVVAPATGPPAGPVATLSLERPRAVPSLRRRCRRRRRDGR